MLTAGVASVLLACKNPQAAHSVSNGMPKNATATHMLSALGNPLLTIDPESDILRKVTYETVTMRQLPIKIEATGQLQANANAVSRISAPTPGKVVSVSASLGDLVKKGQTVAVITSQEIGGLVTDLYKEETDIDSDLSRDIQQIEFEIEQNQTQLNLCRKQYERAKVLLDERIGALANVETAQTELEKHELAVQALNAKRESTKQIAEQRKHRSRQCLEQKLSILGMPDSAIKAVLNKRDLVNSIPLVTPQTGIVLERDVNVGELIDPSRTIMVEDDIDNLWLVADVFEQDVKHMRVGQPVEFWIDSFPGESFSGRLDYVAGTINPETRTLAVRAVIPNPGFRLKPKMFARLKIDVGTKSALMIPANAVQTAGSKKVVYLPTSSGSSDNKGAFEERVIEPGETVDGFTIVKSGLEEGERVVVNESLALRTLSLNK